MCKLCNTDNKPQAIKHNCIKESFSSQFKHIVFEYTGKYPCKSCIIALPSKNTVELYGGIDTYIIGKLFRKYYQKLYTREDIKSAGKIFYSKPKDKESAVDVCIRKRVSGCSGDVSFIVAKRINGKQHKRSFFEINEAIQYRDSLKK